MRKKMLLIWRTFLKATYKGHEGIQEMNDLHAQGRTAEHPEYFRQSKTSPDEAIPALSQVRSTKGAMGFDLYVNWTKYHFVCLPKYFSQKGEGFHFFRKYISYIDFFFSRRFTFAHMDDNRRQ